MSSKTPTLKRLPYEFVKICKSKSITKALADTKSYISHNINPIQSIRNRYYDWKGGTQDLCLNGVTAQFDAKSKNGGDNLRVMYESEDFFLQDMLEELDDGDVFYDIGANIGIFSCFAAQKMDVGHIVSFEPYPPNVNQLHKNLLYNADKSDFTLFDIALSNSDGSVEFSSPDKRAGHQTGNISPSGPSIDVKSTPGDKLIDERTLPEPTVVKIDVEGSEPLVIQGLEDTLKADTCRILYCELHLPRADRGRPSIMDYGETKKVC
ncbi:FkbM family methyltransferase [Halorubrum sp. BOL3-1]|uniref:FkbM family methyltransferase n=1 Tax=Halorubrum sp. BOL3-1 TaxID=2497325 RepID=UPI001004FE68|nr:FkbM family methyltransferase [Halorubrum sp. BOL3-1]QAU12260.1 FkbM family methyltransferase [Halorubrum sp. BOL3-1]